MWLHGERERERERGLQASVDLHKTKKLMAT